MNVSEIFGEYVLNVKIKTLWKFVLWYQTKSHLKYTIKRSSTRLERIKLSPSDAKRWATTTRKVGTILFVLVVVEHTAHQLFYRKKLMIYLVNKIVLYQKTRLKLGYTGSNRNEGCLEMLTYTYIHKITNKGSYLDIRKHKQSIRFIERWELSE